MTCLPAPVRSAAPWGDATAPSAADRSCSGDLLADFVGQTGGALPLEVSHPRPGPRSLPVTNTRLCRSDRRRVCVPPPTASARVRRGRRRRARPTDGYLTYDSCCGCVPRSAPSVPAFSLVTAACAQFPQGPGAGVDSAGRRLPLGGIHPLPLRIDHVALHTQVQQHTVLVLVGP